MDHDDALTKLEGVPEGEGEPPGQLFDAGEGLDPWVSPAAALLLSLQTNKQLWKEKEITSAPRSYQSLAAAYVFRGSGETVPAAGRAPVYEHSRSYLSVWSCTWSP